MVEVRCPVQQLKRPEDNRNQVGRRPARIRRRLGEGRESGSALPMLGAAGPDDKLDVGKDIDFRQLQRPFARQAELGGNIA